MIERMHTTSRGRRAASIGRLLVTAALILSALAVTACCDQETKAVCQTKRPATPVGEPTIISLSTTAQPGELVTRQVTAGGPSPIDGQVTYVLPPGASEALFAGDQPDNYFRTNDGGWAYVFNGSDAQFTATYTLGPSDQAGQWRDYVETCWGPLWQDQKHTAVFVTNDTSSALRQIAAPAAAPLPRAAPEEDYWYWRTAQFFLAEGVTMTKSLAQEALTPWQGDGMFYAMKIPVPESPPTQSQPLPVVFLGHITPTLKLIEVGMGGRTLITAPVEYRLGRVPFLEGTQPAGAGKMWVPVGLTSDPLLYPTEPFTLTEGEWEFGLDLALDLGGAPEGLIQAAGTELVVETYYCFEGNQPGVATALLASALGGDLPPAFAGQGITCLGPQPLFLASAPPLSLQPAVTLQVTPAQAISLNHYVMTMQPMTITLNISSTLDASWAIYRQPNLTDPITPGAPIYVSGGFNFWVAGVIPADIADGGYGLVVTATPMDPPGNARWTQDNIWVGEWSPPVQHRIYLPLVVREAQ